MNKVKVSKEKYKELIDEIVHCNKALEKRFDKYVANTINQLIQARIEFSNSELEREG